MASKAHPTYGELLMYLKDAELEATTRNESVAILLEAKLHSNYPTVYVGRPGRFMDTVRRIAAPTQASSIGCRKLEGEALASYIKRTWKPRIRTQLISQGLLEYLAEIL